jgi:hypothetical protein
MSEVPDPTGGWAKATEATANASKEAIQAGRDLGSFVSGPAGEIVGMLWDHLKVVRFERQIRLRDRVHHFLTERSMDSPTRTIPLKIGLPLLDHATLEEDDELQDIWARLLINGGDANSGVELRKAFVSILADLSAFDAQLLAVIAAAPNADTTGVLTFYLPGAVLPPVEGQAPPGPSEAVAVALWNLVRLACVTPATGWGGTHIGHVFLSPLGKAFVTACSSSPRKLE